MASIGMARHWQKVSPQEAREHPLYGVKNWLAVFAFGVLIGPLQVFGGLSGSAGEAGITVKQLLAYDLADTGFLTLSLGYSMAIAAILLWLLFTLHPRFRVLATVILLGNGPLYLLLAALLGAMRTPGVTGELTRAFIGTSFWLILWAIYLHRSRRVRVTFEHCVLAKSSGSAFSFKKREPSGAQWAQAMAELDEGSADKAIWAQAFSQSDGDESKARARYIQMRARQIHERTPNLMTTVPAPLLHTDEGSNDAPSVPRAKKTSRGILWEDLVVIALALVGGIGYMAYKNKWSASTLEEPRAAIQAPRAASPPPISTLPLTVRKEQELLARAERGEFPTIKGQYSPSAPANGSLWDSPASLEQSQTWWHEPSGIFKLHVQNRTNLRLNTLGLTYFYKDCKATDRGTNFFITLHQALEPNQQALVTFPTGIFSTNSTSSGQAPELDCLTIVSAWSTIH